MGALSDLDVDDVGPGITGLGRRLVEWWQQADDEDRATFRAWVDAGVSCLTLAERLTASGWKVSQHTVMYGLRRLRKAEWAP